MNAEHAIALLQFHNWIVDNMQSPAFLNLYDLIVKYYGDKVIDLLAAMHLVSNTGYEACVYSVNNLIATNSIPIGNLSEAREYLLDMGIAYPTIQYLEREGREIDIMLNKDALHRLSQHAANLKLLIDFHQDLNDIYHGRYQESDSVA